MITRREAYFVILAVALSSVLAITCPNNKVNELCVCDLIPWGIEIHCVMHRDRKFYVNIDIHTTYIIKIESTGSPEWEDLRLDVSVVNLLKTNVNIRSMMINNCKVSNNDSSNDITNVEQRPFSQHLTKHDNEECLV